ncbi:MAG: iron-containing alcohol dehydrogenase [Solirubrobacterales bacterium]
MKPQSAAASAAVSRRYMELPRYLRVVTGQAELAETLTAVARDLGFANLCVVSGAGATAGVAEGLASGLAQLAVSHVQATGDGRDVAESLAAADELRDADVVVAVGGGKTIDVTKLACELADVPVVTVPTQLTADGIASPISVVRDSAGHTQSMRARMPIAVLADLDVIAASPVASMRAGLGDLVANPCAIRDWRLAANADRESVDDFAALLAQTATDLVYATGVAQLGAEQPDRDFLRRLLEGLVLSGLAMEIAGSSRPCSGSEHLFSHALDRLRPGTAAHGEQVAFGSLLAARLHGADWRSLQSFLRSAGMERAASGFGLSENELIEVLEVAPSTRPDRYTVLDEVDEPELGAAVRDVLTA